MADRTLRRWLAELVHEGVIERSGSRKGTRYRWKPSAQNEQRPPTHADATLYQPIFSPESVQLLERIDAPLYARPPRPAAGLGDLSQRPVQSAAARPKRRT